MFSFNKGKDLIRKKITLVSKNPGVYRMLDKKNEILYVGKAKNLPSRLKNYISEKNLPIRTERMLSQTKNIEITTTSNESEALLLEANLIKKHKPKFNILLKDDKSFPYIFIGKNEKWPQLIKHRGKKTRDGHYFGPFASVGSANWTIKTLQKIFLLRVCDDGIFKKRRRPCILYQIKRCSAPCMGYVDPKSYKKLVDNSIKFISGKTKNIQKDLSKQMEAASNELDYEKAAVLRDGIKALTQIQSSQNVNATNLSEADVIAAYKESGKSCVQIFFFRSKQNWGNQSFFPKHDPDEDLSKILSSFIMQFYENKNAPKLIIINKKINDQKLIERTLELKENKSVSIKIARKGNELKISTMAEKNAKEALTRKVYETESNRNLFEELSNKFSLKSNINLIEVYDNSHIQGSNSVGALITFGSEGFIKKRYRKFNIKSENIKNDDYAMLKEVLFRRFSKVIKDTENTLSLPDFVLVDGGKGQYSVARKTIDELGLYDIPIVAIAKGKFRNSGNETFFFENKTFKFSRNDPILFFLQRLRDEAHRFAVNAHRDKRIKGMKKSLLDQINGIGKIRKKTLLNHFGSARAVESASLDEIKSIDGIEPSIAKKIHNFFHS
ncbi:MAG: excinuclease ABC subunit UvrC [Pelagibacteraceae bacterium]|jgi:excinuclease ABC subunit C|nr:excinuclease ABC subunit UvrC [Pelagibacteraceae bacterium]